MAKELIVVMMPLMASAAANVGANNGAATHSDFDLTTVKDCNHHRHSTCTRTH